ncbi:hypothetical protein PCASD_00733 [Puccinia coronata f. sp. avenae]|uniref:Uncharacterized protein n=1 Tax=Puccinia coronata f. sp. avenae TaxID=200324 RepID=A0A2N5TCF1_9BASI|nr:hypothetical protein PCASD_10513 [Puccinia coronata f. sp. avenae]PLW50702.1 hypothetical protein PCASD_00733 [Puccinia coronata f. sp. avenae]
MSAAVTVTASVEGARQHFEHKGNPLENQPPASILENHQERRRQESDNIRAALLSI